MYKKAASIFSPLLIASLGASMLMLAGCGNSQSASEPEHAGKSVAAKAPIGAINPGRGTHKGSDRFTAVSPDNYANLGLPYKVFEFAPDGNWVNVVPMAPDSDAAPVVIQVNTAGRYEVKLDNPKCAFPVDVDPGSAGAFTLTSQAKTHSIELAANSRLKVVMAPSAKNNYSCNTVVTAAGN